MNVGAKRLMIEHKQISKRKNLENFVACPDPKNIFEWYYVIFGLKDCNYEGGFYFGKVVFPKSYPNKPPSIMMITPSGRFTPKSKICMSISNHHPESWNPAWNMQTIMIGLISFMIGNEHTVGAAMITSDQMKRDFAKISLDYNLHNYPKFKDLFSHQFDEMGIN